MLRCLSGRIKLPSGARYQRRYKHNTEPHFKVGVVFKKRSIETKQKIEKKVSEVSHQAFRARAMGGGGRRCEMQEE